MNKVLNINLGGYPFTIDENAYTFLSEYLTSIHNHFRDSEGYEEITGDIEARMAELFQEQLSGRPIVTTKDINNAIAIMGTPEDFGVEPMEEPVHQESGKGKKYKTGKRLFRNSDDEVVGGVCSGLAAYFGIEDPVWIRIAWIVFTISGGLGIPAYIILWVIVPKAETAGDRLAMRGQKINVSNIGKIVEEEIDSFSEKMEHFGKEFQSKKKTGETGFKRPNGLGSAVKKGISLLGFVISRVLFVLAKIWKPIFFIVGFALIIALSVMWIMSIIGFFMALPYASYFFAGSKILSFLGVVNILTLIGVPLLALIMFLSKHVFKTRTSPHFKAGMWSFFVVNIISLFAIGSYQASQFSNQSSLSKEVDLSAINMDTLQIKIASDPYPNATFMIGDLKVSDHRLISRHVHLDIQKTTGDQFELTQEIYSYGNSDSEATKLAGTIEYTVQLEDNALIFPKIIEFPKGEKWRNQFVTLTLKVPEGKFIYLQDDLWSIGHDIEIDRKQEYPRFEENQTWRMDENGLVNLEFLRKSLRSEEFKFKDFESLQIEGQIKVTIEKGAVHKITLSGKPHFLDKIEFVQLDKTLTITSENDYVTSPIRMTITLPQLNLLDLKNTDDVKVQGFTQKTMRVKHDGDDELGILAQIDSLYLRQTGNSEVTLKGTGVFLEAVLDKSTKLDANRYSLKNAKIDAGVHSRASLAVSDSLWQYIAGGAQITVDGSPVIDEKTDSDQ
ncbi:MAG: phage shock protein PspC (stress-responsive transcriptional regulator) [Saprospiraceae bacterium]|jgi:phage shock protein PspC (stress-responsive transcriptional regulator)